VKDAAPLTRGAPDPDRQIADVVEREQVRLRRFIGRRVPDRRDAEDILQDVFYKLVEANRLLMPIDHVTAWLFRVARNRIADLFRSRRANRLADAAGSDEIVQLEELLPSPDAGPDALYARNVMLDELAVAVKSFDTAKASVAGSHARSAVGFAALFTRTEPVHTPLANPVTNCGDAPVAA